VAPSDRDIAMVFQSYALYPHMTVFGNMAFGLRIKHLAEAEIQRRVAAAAASLGLTGYLDRLPKALSGGQRQRVAIGRAVVREPKVFLFDEPLSNLDAKLRSEMRREIARIHRQAETTSLYVTHDQIEAMTLADRVVVLEGGVIQQVGTPMDLYMRPVNLFVAGFIGSPAMNMLDAEIIRREAPCPAPDRHREHVHLRRADEAGDELVDRIVVERLRRRHLLDMAVLHHHDPVGHRHRLDLIMGHINEGRIEAFVQFGDFGPHCATQLGVKV
jgi:ABC-type sugar transport system ATPase subunit